MSAEKVKDWHEKRNGAPKANGKGTVSQNFRIYVLYAL
jgi:hypothetical protein